MALIQRDQSVIVGDELLFENWEIKENGDNLEINNNAINAITINDSTRLVKIANNFQVNGDFNGDIIYVGDEVVTTAGALYQLSDGATWELAVADAVSSSTKLLGIALGSDSTSGFLIRGTVTLASSTGGSDGDVLYVSTTDGRITATAPTASGAVVRAVGYALVVSDLKIWFNPDNTWVELS